MMHERLRYLNETLNITLDNYAYPSFFSHTKRSLINEPGQLSSMLFGTAMDEDVEDLRERYNPLASLAANQSKAINMNSLHINRPEHAIQDIASYSRTVRTGLNAVIEAVKGIHEMVLINQALHALESAINTVLHTNNLVIQNEVDADRGRVTSSLFPVKDLASPRQLLTFHCIIYLLFFLQLRKQLEGRKKSPLLAAPITEQRKKSVQKRSKFTRRDVLTLSS